MRNNNIWLLTITFYTKTNIILYFLNAKYVTNSNIILTIWIRSTSVLYGFVGTCFHSPRSCGMAYKRQCSFKKRVYFHFKGRQRTCSSSGVAQGMWAAVPCFFSIKNTLKRKKLENEEKRVSCYYTSTLPTLPKSNQQITFTSIINSR